MNYTLITGASKGLGREFADLSANAGQNVILTARDEAALNELAAELRQKHQIDARVVVSDLSDTGSARKLYQTIKDLGLRVDTLINNAGYGQHGEFLSLNADLDTRMLQLNMITLTELCRFFGQEMVEAGRGRILNVASTAAFQPGPLMSTYYASKAYVLSFTEALHLELQAKGVSVTALCPGPTVTEFQKRANIENARMFKKGFSMEARPVAEAGFAAMNEGTRLVIPGFLNWMATFSVRLTPRAAALRISRMISSKES